KPGGIGRSLPQASFGGGDKDIHAAPTGRHVRRTPAEQSITTGSGGKCERIEGVIVGEIRLSVSLQDEVEFACIRTVEEVPAMPGRRNRPGSVLGQRHPPEQRKVLVVVELDLGISGRCIDIASPRNHDEFAANGGINRTSYQWCGGKGPTVANV